MVGSVGASVESRVGSNDPAGPPLAGALRLRLMGPLEVWRDGAAVALPPSRKVRGLLAYLALAPRPCARARLCELLWDVPDDPRGELRWCLSKLRRLVDGAGRRRIQAEGDAVRLDLTGCEVDVLEVQRATASGVAGLGLEEASALASRFGGDLLDGLTLERSPAFEAWLASQRRRLRGTQLALLELLAARAPAEAALGHLEQWLALAPLDRRAHEQYLAALARAGRLRDGEEHLALASRRFAEEGLDAAPLRAAWRQDRPLATAPAVAPASEAPGVEASPAAHRASVLVLPLDEAGAGARGGLAGALAHDVIARLAKLRCLLVIAEGTALALAGRRLEPAAAGRLVGVDYQVTVAARATDQRLAVEVHLEEVRTARAVWSERFDEPRGATFEVLEEVGDRIVASAASEIEANERSRAILRPPGTLDAWEAHHRGLWHMYRFTREDNRAARDLFARAVALDPTFSRAHAGLSFTHWQDAFQGWAARQPAVAAAREAARLGLLADDRDPAAHWAEGRALWLEGHHRQAVGALREAVDLSPNFAQGHYTLAFVEAQDGDPLDAIAAADRSRTLSPFDPLLFGMLGARAIALVRLGRYQEAAEAAARAAARPNAHAHIQAIAAACLALGGALDEARGRAGEARRLVPDYALAQFFQAFRLEPEGAARLAEGARLAGLR